MINDASNVIVNMEKFFFSFLYLRNILTNILRALYVTILTNRY